MTTQDVRTAGDVVDFAGVDIAWDARVLEPRAWTADQGRWAADLARTCVLNGLAAIKSVVGDLELETVNGPIIVQKVRSAICVSLIGSEDRVLAHLRRLLIPRGERLHVGHCITRPRHPGRGRLGVDRHPCLRRHGVPIGGGGPGHSPPVRRTPVRPPTPLRKMSTRAPRRCPRAPWITWSRRCRSASPAQPS